MTRDEAIKIEIKKLNKLSAFHPRSMLRDVATANIDALIELGLLKVDEPDPYIRLKLPCLGGTLNFCHYNNHSLTVMPIVEKVGDTIGLQISDAMSLIKYLNNYINMAEK